MNQSEINPNLIEEYRREIYEESRDNGVRTDIERIPGRTSEREGT